MKKSRNAFTMIEIMMALVIFCGLMGIITNAVHVARKLGRQNRDTGDRYLEQYTTILVAAEDCRNFLQPMKGSNEPAFIRDVLDENEVIRFCTVVQRPMTRRGIYRVVYKAENGKLVRELVTESRDGGTGGESVSRLEFLDDVKGVKFLFGDDPGSLASNWPYSNRVPRYIGFEITIEKDGASHTLDWAFSLGQVS